MKTHESPPTIRIIKNKTQSIKSIIEADLPTRTLSRSPGAEASCRTSFCFPPLISAHFSPEEASPPPAALQHLSPATRPPQRGSAGRLRRPEREGIRGGGYRKARCSRRCGRETRMETKGDRGRGGRMGGRRRRRRAERCESRNLSRSFRWFIGSNSSTAERKKNMTPVTSELLLPSSSSSS